MTTYTCYNGSTETNKIYVEQDKTYKVYKVFKEGNLVWRERKYDKNQIIFDSSTAGTFSIYLDNGIYDVICVGGGGAAAMRGVYDDKGYGWGGGSGGGFVGRLSITNKGTYTVVVGSANNNTKSQSSDTQISNPSDTSTHDSYISGIIRCGGGGSGHYNSSYVGAAGSAPVIDSSVTLISSSVNRAGNAGSSKSGGNGSDSAVTASGGASVYGGYGKGQGCKVHEYARRRSWINGTNGYIRIIYIEDNENKNIEPEPPTPQDPLYYCWKITWNVGNPSYYYTKTRNPNIGTTYYTCANNYNMATSSSDLVSNAVFGTEFSNFTENGFKCNTTYISGTGAYYSVGNLFS